MYYAMYKVFAEPILSNQPKAAQYDNQTIILTSICPVTFKGEINDISKLGFDELDEGNGLSPEQLTALVDSLRAQEPNKMLLKMTKQQGRWLYDNHPAFKRKEDV